MNIIPFLSKFIDESFTRVRSTPFPLRNGKTVWSVVTNGTLFVGVQREVMMLPYKDAPLDLLLPLIKTPVRPGAQVEVKTLLEWSEPISEGVTWSSLDDVEVLDYLGVVSGVIIDRRKLSFLLQSLEEESVYLWDASNATKLLTPSLGVEWDSGKGRAILAGVDPSKVYSEKVFQPPKSYSDSILEELGL
jgi:hypothetical protein